MMTSAIPSVDPNTRLQAVTAHEIETDSIPRLKVRDLMISLQFLGRNPEADLEALRIKLQTDRKMPGARTAGYSVARDVASELDRLGYADVGPLPKDAKSFESKRRTQVRLTATGRELAHTLRHDRAEAYVTLLKKIVQRASIPATFCSCDLKRRRACARCHVGETASVGSLYHCESAC